MFEKIIQFHRPDDPDFFRFSNVFGQLLNIVLQNDPVPRFPALEMLESLVNL